ncbi:RNA-guided endonuclease TnpB family protein [Lactobacillus delbrueckii subsp. bulgaricus]|uniref:RNA-guided endonuclease TnpB family protein n=1 Tax=Lactobacillus delbrueckii TaxID=1584 RepID=UPI0037CBEE24
MTRKKRRTQTKTVRAYTVKLNGDELKELDELFTAYGKCRDFLYSQLCGINHMTDVANWYGPRDKIREHDGEIKKARKAVKDWKKAYKKNKAQGLKSPDSRTVRLSKQKLLSEQFGIQGRHVTEAVKDVCMNLNSMWSNLGLKLKRIVQANDALSNAERQYLNYIFTSPYYWQLILQRRENEAQPNEEMSQYPALRAALSKEQLRHCFGYIRRLTRKHKPHPHSTAARCMLCDEVMWKVVEKDGSSYLEIMTAKCRKKKQFKLTGPYCYANKKKRGDIQLILDRDKKRLEVHRAIKAVVHNIRKPEKQLGIDKGLATLISCSSGQEYGADFSKMIGAEVERINDRNTNRNEYIQSAKELREEKFALQEKLAKDYSAKTKERIRHRIGSLERQIARLEEHHLGSKLYHRQHERKQRNMERVMNTSIRQMLVAEDPDVLVKEDLTFTKEKLPKTSNRYEAKVRRKLSSWTKGRLDKRIEYLCGSLGIQTIDVNPAYTSQFCPRCGVHFSERKGAHHETAVCPNCGEMNANTAAAVNILQRADDKEITKYMPYKNVKLILEDRYANKQLVMA